jgi:hypothetical protein
MCATHEDASVDGSLLNQPDQYDFTRTTQSNSDFDKSVGELYDLDEELST